MNIEQTISNHKKIMVAIDEILELQSNQYTDLVTYDKDKQLFEVSIVTEAEGIEYDDAYIPLQAVESHMQSYKRT